MKPANCYKNHTQCVGDSCTYPFGVYEWHQGNYRISDAVVMYRNRKAAQRFADEQSRGGKHNYVVRETRYVLDL